jgi:putative phosphoribosyl transferase
MRFRDRTEAGRQLARALEKYYQAQNTVVLGLPRGGVVIAYEVANALDLPLDVFLVRKLGTPGQEELAFGAIAENGACFFNEDIVQSYVTDAEKKAVIEQQKEILRQRQASYRGVQPALKLEGKNVILVDDGIATGATMEVAIKGIRLGSLPRKIVVAVPVAPTSNYHMIEREVDEIVCLEVSDFLASIGQFYENFEQVSDDTVIDLLKKAQKE